MSELTLVIGNKNYSSWSLRPWLLLKHFDIDFDEVRIALYNDQARENLAMHSPSLKVPVLNHHGQAVWDSLAICEYISETFLNNRGWPSRPEARAIARSASAEMHSGFFALRNELPMNCRKQHANFELSSNVLNEVARIKAIWSECRERFYMDGDWLCGEFSIVDCMFAPVVIRFHGYGVVLEGDLKVYVDRVLSHPHVAAWMKDGENESEVIEMAEV